MQITLVLIDNISRGQNLTNIYPNITSTCNNKKKTYWDKIKLVKIGTVVSCVLERKLFVCTSIYIRYVMSLQYTVVNNSFALNKIKSFRTLLGNQLMHILFLIRKWMILFIKL